jgi:signal transduction histidine kinase
MSIDLYHLITDKARIEKVLDFLPYPFIVSEFKDNTYYNLYLNKRFQEEIGYSLEEMPTIGDWFILAYPDAVYRQEVIEGWQARTQTALLNEEDSILMKVIIRTKYEGYQWFEVKCTIAGQIQLVAFVNIGEAIIKEKELQRLNENKDRTLSILAHDLRAPITNVHSLTELLLEGNISKEEFMSRVHHLHQRSGQLLDFIDTTLLWTKANFESIEVKPEEIIPGETVQKVLSIYESACHHKNLSVTVAFEHSKIRTDPEIIKILLRNVISNAIKFTPDKGHISIAGKQDNGHFCISICDTGVGMTRETIDKIYMENYFSSRGTRQEKGLGLGLKLCHHLVKKINAKLEIESQPGKGTIVNLIL